VVIYGMIFNVDPKKNRRFMQKEEIAREKEQTKEGHEAYRIKLEKINQRERALRMRIIQEKGIED
jgi:hypothetical protein